MVVNYIRGEKTQIHTRMALIIVLQNNIKRNNPENELPTVFQLRSIL